jgi:hypothetical protein
MLRIILFNGGDQQLERFRLVHGQVSQDLTIKANPFLTQHVNEGRVGQPFRTNSGVDTGDPQRAILSLLEFAADITVLQPLFENVLGYGIYIFTFAIEPFGLFEDTFPACPGCDGVD